MAYAFATLVLFLSIPIFVNTFALCGRRLLTKNRLGSIHQATKMPAPPPEPITDQPDPPNQHSLTLNTFYRQLVYVPVPGTEDKFLECFFCCHPRSVIDQAFVVETPSGAGSGGDGGAGMGDAELDDKQSRETDDSPYSNGPYSNEEIVRSLERRGSELLEGAKDAAASAAAALKDRKDGVDIAAPSIAGSSGAVEGWKERASTLCYIPGSGSLELHRTTSLSLAYDCSPCIVVNPERTVTVTHTAGTKSSRNPLVGEFSISKDTGEGKLGAGEKYKAIQSWLQSSYPDGSSDDKDKGDDDKNVGCRSRGLFARGLSNCIGLVDGDNGADGTVLWVDEDDKEKGEIQRKLAELAEGSSAESGRNNIMALVSGRDSENSDIGRHLVRVLSGNEEEDEEVGMLLSTGWLSTFLKPKERRTKAIKKK